MYKVITILIFIIFSNVCVGGVLSKEVDGNTAGKQVEPVVQTEKIQSYKFGLLPYISMSRLVKTYLPLKLYLENALMVRIDLLSASSYDTFVGRTANQSYDLIFTAPHFAALANRDNDYEGLMRFDAELQASLFVRQNSSVQTLADLKSKLIGLPGELTMVSMLGNGLLQQNNLIENENIFYNRTQTHFNVILSVEMNKVAAGIVAANVLKVYLKDNADKMRIISNTVSVPSAMFMINKKISEVRKNKIRQLFNNFSDSDYGKQFFRSVPVKNLVSVSDGDMLTMNLYLDRLAELRASSSQSKRKASFRLAVDTKF